MKFLLKTLLLLYLLLLSLLASMGVRAETKPATPLECGDFLRNLGLGRPDVQFVGCDHTDTSSPQDALQARYRVNGKDIANVERWLVKLAHVSKLKYRCCGWETGMGSFIGDDGAEYIVGMGGETIESSRAKLAQIPYLSLTVTHYLYEP